MKDYFDIKKEFLRRKNADLAEKLEQDFAKALGKNQICDILLDDSKKLSQFKNKMRDLCKRLNSVGFEINQMKIEEKEWEDFIKNACNPDRLPKGMETDWVTVAEEPTTLVFAFESFLFFVDSTFNYLSQLIGVIFGNPGVTSLDKLKNILKNNYFETNLAKRIIDMIEKGEPLWVKKQEKRREYFDNVEPYFDVHKDKSLRDIIAHYQTIKVCPMQMTIGRKGYIPEHTVKAGSWKAKLGEKPIWGNQSFGLINEAEKYVKNLLTWIESILKLIY